MLTTKERAEKIIEPLGIDHQGLKDLLNEIRAFRAESNAFTRAKDYVSSLQKGIKIDMDKIKVIDSCLESMGVVQKNMEGMGDSLSSAMLMPTKIILKRKRTFQNSVNRKRIKLNVLQSSMKLIQSV